MAEEMALNKLWGALGLARKAGCLVGGFDAVCERARSGEASVVLLATDFSQGSRKRVRFACEGTCPVYDIPLTQAEIAAITKKPVGVLAVTNKDLAALCTRSIPGEGRNEEEPV